MEISIMFVIVLFSIGFVGSFLSGMVGVGGAIVKYPMLLFIPPLFGITAFSAHQVSGISAVEILFATLAGVLAYRKGGFLNKQLIIYMGTAILIGSFIGSFGSRQMSEDMVNIVYGILALIAAVMMFIPKKLVEDRPSEEIQFNKVLAVSLAFIIGIGSGIVGAAGGFLLVPILLVILKIPTRITIATSLAITFISSIGSAFGKIVTGQVEFAPAIIMIIASLIAAPLGAKFGNKMNTKVLQGILAVLILATAIKIWMDIL
ncbi:sulfite exporter TauE/SafE family protein [Paenisporosarcina cavernae]|uniref:Probable membrane transporter protein n=1 Tax=Paenisporosarcina cavernae TaxID=2320858 RepID=A0A385YQE0_9BACL|nr:sulfite exporter TauE/SafE family protein [Paenisporosarcina cavernae]AYC28754.1 sulfite exporter TauE/SafE family protein [Paenisporosarcina cavernae]